MQKQTKKLQEEKQTRADLLKGTAGKVVNYAVLGQQAAATEDRSDDEQLPARKSPVRGNADLRAVYGGAQKKSIS